MDLVLSGLIYSLGWANLYCNLEPFSSVSYILVQLNDLVGHVGCPNLQPMLSISKLLTHEKDSRISSVFWLLGAEPPMGRILAPRCPDLFEIPEHQYQ